jgi:hypothetical protein
MKAWQNLKAMTRLEAGGCHAGRKLLFIFQPVIFTFQNERPCNLRRWCMLRIASPKTVLGIHTSYARFQVVLMNPKIFFLANYLE